jgi:dolichol-phosphate mannosyltransferase
MPDKGDNPLIKMLLKFAIVGMTGVAVNMAVYAPLTALHWHYLIAAACSFLAAVTNNFIWNMLWTFRGRAGEKSIRRKYITFLVISVVNLGVNLFILRLLVEFMHWEETIAQLGAIAVVSICNFTMNYIITFAETRDGKVKEAATSYETGYHTNV